MARVIKSPPQRQSKIAGSARFSSHDEIAAVLGAEILSGARKPGTRMPSVEEMYQTFGISRVVVREVTKTLAAKGMVESKTRVGTLVLDSSYWNWLDQDVLAWRMNLGVDFDFLAQIEDVRRAVEPVAAALAAEHRTRDDVSRLRSAIRAMRQAEGNRAAFAEADLAFHVAVSAASGNSLFRSFTAVIEAALFGLLAVISDDVFSHKEAHGVVTTIHERVFDAIVARNKKAAAEAMQLAINMGGDHLDAQSKIKSKKKSI